mgnify:CR=1 FL=1
MTTIPIIADCDNGFGNAINVIRTVQEYEAAGIAGICMEDNVFPKRCSFYAGVKRELAQAIRLARHGAYRLLREAGEQRPIDAELRLDLEDAIEGQTTLGDDLIQPLAIDVAHGEEVDALVLLDRVDGDDVRMLERGDGRGLALEASPAIRSSSLSWEV